MVRWRSYPLYLLIGCIILVACSLLSPERPLPTLVPTSVSIAPQGNLAQESTATAHVGAELPTPAIPTASPTSPPTPTDAGSVLAEETGTVASNVGRAFATSNSQATVELGTAEIVQPTATPSLTPSVIPSDTPTNVPEATSTATAVPFPRPPEVIWPSPVPHNQPVSTAPRHGVGVAWGGAPEGAYGSGLYSWTYTWTAYVPPVPRSTQHVPMLAGNTRMNLPDVELIRQLDGYSDHNYWLVFNECEHQLQCNASPPEAAQYFHDQVLDLLFTQGGDPDADIIIGGVNAHPCGILWLKNFVDYYRVTYGELPVAGWHFHLYPEMAPGGWPDSCNGSWGFYDWNFQEVDSAFNLWREHAASTLAFVQEYGEPDDEIWFTEVGCLNHGNHQIQGPACQAEGFMQGYTERIFNWLNNDGRWVTRYAWYTNYDGRYWRATHLIWDAPTGEQWTYSSLGYWYAHVVPAAAVPLPGFQ